MLGVDPLYLILLIASALGVIHAISIRGIFFHSPDTDNELMAYAAAQSHKWRWLSDVHKYNASRAKVAVKEWTIILLSVFQRILNDRTTDRPYVAMTGFAVSASAIIIYLIASNYFNPVTGFIVAFFYLISFWPWQVSLYGGHVNIANLFFLLSIYSTQFLSYSSLFFSAAGAFLCFALFSSPSAQKYILPAFLALFFSSYASLIKTGHIQEIIEILPLNTLWIWDLIFVLGFIVVNILVLLNYKKVVWIIYNNQGPNFLNKMISARDKFSLEHYTQAAYNKIKKIRRWIFRTLIGLLLIINLLPIQVLILFLAGFFLVFLLTTLPNVKDNTIEYFKCLTLPKKKTHFKFYIDFFAKKGIPVSFTTRGAGISWVPKIFWLFMPFHLIFFLTLFAIGLYKSFGNTTDTITLIAIATISISTLIWIEVSGGPQVSRTYSPILITSLLLPAYVISGLTSSAPAMILTWAFICLTFLWNVRRYIDDVYPSRMTVKNLMKTLEKLGIKDIYTYKTVFNYLLIDAIPGVAKPEYLPERDIESRINVRYIKEISEVKDGWIVIPGKNLLEAEVMKETDDYLKDKTLQRLLANKQLDKMAYIKFKTRDTSSIWINEDEVTSYCALYLDYLPEDRYYGYAWLVHSSKLNFNS